MKILVVSNLYPPFVIGGYEMNCRNIAEGLLERGHEVIVLTSYNPYPGGSDPHYVRRRLRLSAHVPDYGEEHEPRASLHSRDTSDITNIFALRESILELQPDIVFLWNLHGVGGLHIIDMLNTHDIPWAIYLGDRVFEQLVNAGPRFMNSVFRGHDPRYFASGNVIAVSQHLVDEIEDLAHFRFPSSPTIVHGYANSPESPIDRSYRIGGVTRFISAGRVSEHKGTHLICEAAAKVAAWSPHRFEVNMYGAGDLAYFANYASSLSAGKYVTFHGSVSQPVLYSLLDTHDAFLFPTWTREPFAFAPFEAAARGCVPVLTADCGCSERIVDGVHGIKIERTSDALAEAMSAIIAGQVDLERIGRAAAEMVRSDMSLPGHIDKIIKALTDHARPTEVHSLQNPRSMLLDYVKHHLSLAFRYNISD